MRKLSKKSKAAIVVTAAVGIAAASGAAYAFWSTSGSGTGTAVTSAGSPSLVVTQTGSPSDLAPGVATEPVTGTVKNTAANSAHTTQIAVTVSSVAPSSCDVSNYGLTAGSTHTVLTTGSQTVTLPFVRDLTPGQTIDMPAFDIGFINKTVAQDECKSATPTVSYVVS